MCFCFKSKFTVSKMCFVMKLICNDPFKDQPVLPSILSGSAEELVSNDDVEDFSR